MFSSNPEPVQPSFSQPAPGTAFSGPLPSSVGGYSKLGSGAGAKVAANYSSKTDPAGTGAMYAKGSKPAFLVATLPSLAGYPPADLLGVVTSGLDNKQSAGSAIGTTTTTTAGGATIACAPIVAAGSPLATVCAMSGPATAVVFANSGDAKTTGDFTAALSKSI
jgi:hypothetical protein